jgi:hypothetical protein
MNELLVLAALAIPLALNLWATRVVFRDTLNTQKQRRNQLLLVWLLPLVGAILVLGVHRSSEKPSRKYRESEAPVDGTTTALNSD